MIRTLRRTVYCTVSSTMSRSSSLQQQLHRSMSHPLRKPRYTGGISSSGRQQGSAAWGGCSGRRRLVVGLTCRNLIRTVCGGVRRTGMQRRAAMAEGSGMARRLCVEAARLRSVRERMAVMA